jgi:hypothetical protein
MHLVLAAAAGAGLLSTSYIILASLAALCAVLGAIWVCIKLYHKFLKRTSDFLDDWQGEKARPGVEARPGVMARLACQDVMLAEHGAVLEAIQHEVNYNSGSTIKDAVHRIDNTLRLVQGQLTSASAQASANAFEAVSAADAAAGHAADNNRAAVHTAETLTAQNAANEAKQEEFRQDRT